MDKQSFIEWARKLQQGYKPNPKVLEQLANVDLIALVGPTGVGKTSIIQKLGLPYVLSDVSRTPRDGEKDNEVYHFKTDYLQMLNEIKAGNYAQFLVGHNNEFYGTHVSSFPASGPATIAVIASALSGIRMVGFRKVVPIYILPPGYAEWMHRIGTGRANDIQARMAEARESLPMAFADSEYHFVLNDDIELAVAEVKSIIEGGGITDHRAELARSSADQLFGRLGIDDGFAI